MNYVLTNKGNCQFFPLKPEDKTKVVVIALAKDENSTLRRWVQHHLDIGFDKIFLGDNNDDDSVLSLLSDYISRGDVEVLDVRGLTQFQEDFYSMFCLAGNYQWAAYIDCDEYIQIRNYTNIKDFLKQVPECDCIYMNWMTMNNHGSFYEENQIELFEPKLPLLYNINNYMFKTIVNSRYRNSWNTHMPLGTKDILYGGYVPHHFDVETQEETASIDGLYYKEIWINHYNAPTIEKIQSKFSRGYPDKNKPSFIGFTSQYSYHTVSTNVFCNLPENTNILDKTLQYKHIGFIVSETAPEYNSHLLQLCTLLKYRSGIIVYVAGISDNMFNILIDFNFCYAHNQNVIKVCKDKDEVKFYTEYYLW